MPPATVAIHGAYGRMGQELLAGLERDPEIAVIGAVARRATADHLTLGSGRAVPLAQDVPSLLQRCQPQALVDFTTAEATLPAARAAARAGIGLVIGTTGLSPEQIQEIAELCRTHGVGGVVAPNFSLGAVLLMHLARVAALYFDYAEIIEMHHEGKLDAPSGTALATAQGMAQARAGVSAFHHVPTEKVALPGTRGGQLQGIAIHSLRLPGLLAHQEVILGAQGQTLSLRHDTISRASYLPGVALAVKEVVKRKGLVMGLEALLGLREGT